jgi:hypothetical protein
MILHADMDCFPLYRVFFNKVEITRDVYMADADRGVLLRRQQLPQGQYDYLPPEHGEVTIYNAAQEKVPPSKAQTAKIGAR